MDEGQPTTELRLTPPELELTRTALELLESALGHDEADELAAVQQLLAKLGRQAQPR
jgi:hypothetical protein